MRKECRTFACALAAMLLFSVSAGAAPSERDLPQLREDLDRLGEICAIVDLGIHNDESATEGISGYSGSTLQTEFYPFIGQIPDERIKSTAGDYNAFCFIPTDGNASVTVYTAQGPNENGRLTRGSVLYQSSSGEPFIIQCMVGDVMSDVLVSVTDSRGRSITDYNPMYSGKDGSLLTTDYLYNATIDPANGYESVLDTIFQHISVGYQDVNVEDSEKGIYERVCQEGAWAKEIGYILEDFSGDGVPELLIGSMPGTGGKRQHIFSVYTISGGEPWLTASGGWSSDSLYYIMDGVFCREGYSEAGQPCFGSYNLCGDGTKLACDKFYFADGAAPNFYSNATGSLDPAASTQENIDADKFWQIESDMLNLSSEIPFTPFSYDRYGSFLAP